VKPANRYAVEIGDLDIDGPELSDEELRATRGGWTEADACSCAVGGGWDWDNVIYHFP
jgi:hypothetical protein